MASKFSITVPYRTNYYENYARILENANLLRSCSLWTRRPMPIVPSDRSHLFPALGLASYIAAKILPAYHSEAARFSLYPLFDRWARKYLVAGDHIISSYAYANECFKWVRSRGGKTFLDGGNSHPENFWTILEEEHRIWECPYPPVPKFYIERAKRMMEDVDFVLSPSTFVTRSFLDRSFKKEQIIDVTYAVDLTTFTPSTQPRPKNRPFTIINTGGLSLRKGTPYLLEAFRLIRKEIPDARLLLTDLVSASIKPILAQYMDLPIEWAPALPHGQLAERLRSADVFILPSLEEGLVRTALEAMACGLPVILTPNTGTAQFVEEGANGSVVPIRDSHEIAHKSLEWWEMIQTGHHVAVGNFADKVSFNALEEKFLGGMARAIAAGRS